jgi:hypothetical protein
VLRIRSVTPLDGRRVRLVLTDGTDRTVDLAPLLRGPVFEAIARDRGAFEAVRVDTSLGTLVWPNGADLDPDVLIQGRAPADL